MNSPTNEISIEARLREVYETSSFQALIGQAQTDITNAQTALSQVGANPYQGMQSSTVWNDIKAAADIIHQLQQMVNHKH